MRKPIGDCVDRRYECPQWSPSSTFPLALKTSILLLLLGLLSAFFLRADVLAQGTQNEGEARPEEAVSVQSTSGSVASDRAALEVFYAAANGANWQQNQHWLSSRPLGDWHGVVTDAGGRVTRLVLWQNGLTGIISAALGDLAYLERLYLWGNQLTGTIPAELGGLTRLERVYLSQNQLTGCIPAAWSELRYTDMGALNLPECSGPELVSLPVVEEATPTPTFTPDTTLAGMDRAALESFYEAANGANWQRNQHWLSSRPLRDWHGVITDAGGRVTRLVLRQNGLTGTISAALGYLAHLERLYLWGNQLTGTIPAELGGLARLERVYLSQNQLTGCIPPAWSELRYTDMGAVNLPECLEAYVADPERAALAALYAATGGDDWTNNDKWLSEESLGNWHGVITDSQGRVSKIDLDENQLVGSIPSELGNLSHLTSLNLGGNQLTGVIPVELGDILGLTSLDLEDNQLVGSIPSELGNLSHLTSLNLGGNQLTGVIPVELGDINDLTSLDLGGNQLTGVIPVELGDILGLTSLDLEENQLVGSIPSELGNLSHLTSLNLGGNQLTGVVPVELGDIYDLMSLDLGGNQLNGGIPVELGDIYGLTSLDLGGNQLTGKIPFELSRSYFLTWLDLEDNQLTGRIPLELGRLPNLITLDISENGLSEEIPAALGNLLRLESLDLQGNQLTGALPPELSFLQALDSLYLSQNQLTGCIPAALNNVMTNDLADLELPECTTAPVEERTGTVQEWIQLESLYFSTGGPNWTNHHNWLSKAPIGEWYGLTTNALGEVTQISLPQNGLTGPFPIAVVAFANLERLSLQGNQLTGSIPAQLGDVAGLEWLYLAQNQLTGCVPIALNALTNTDLSDLGLPACPADPPAITPLDLERAALAALYAATGGDNWKNNDKWLSEESLGNWHGVITDAGGRVTRLVLRQNGLTGTIPAALGDLTHLERLYLWGNQLTGTIPAALGGLARLERVYLSQNQLTGCIPAAWSELQYTDMGDCPEFTRVPGSHFGKPRAGCVGSALCCRRWR